MMIYNYLNLCQKSLSNTIKDFFVDVPVSRSLALSCSFLRSNPLFVFPQGVNGTGGQSERHHRHPQCSACEEENLLQVKMHHLTARS